MHGRVKTAWNPSRVYHMSLVDRAQDVQDQESAAVGKAWELCWRGTLALMSKHRHWIFRASRVYTINSFRGFICMEIISGLTSLTSSSLKISSLPLAFHIHHIVTTLNISPRNGRPGWGCMRSSAVWHFAASQGYETLLISLILVMWRGSYQVTTSLYRCWLRTRTLWSFMVVLSNSLVQHIFVCQRSGRRLRVPKVILHSCDALVCHVSWLIRSWTWQQVRMPRPDEVGRHCLCGRSWF